MATEERMRMSTASVPPTIGPVLASGIDHDSKLAVVGWFWRVVEVAGRKIWVHSVRYETRREREKTQCVLFCYLFVHRIFSETYP